LAAVKPEAPVRQDGNSRAYRLEEVVVFAHRDIVHAASSCAAVGAQQSQHSPDNGRRLYSQLLEWLDIRSGRQLVVAVLRKSTSMSCSRGAGRLC
jgi:hypothetical protein